MGAGKRNSMYRYKVVYPKDVETTCAVCGCRIKITIFTCQQRSVKAYCLNPCSAKRMSPVKLIWSENWNPAAMKAPLIPKEDYMDMLRKSKGISQEAVNATAMLPELY